MSALRGLRSSAQDISFRPWIYEIAKNASIDHLRRARRGSEVSIDSDDFSPQEEGRISQSVSGTDAEVARRKELESLQMAFGDLPQSQHQILVMRELEGLSYDRIGSRLGLTRGAVESQLFRARRTLRDGFDDIDTGERCVRMRVTMEATADGLRTGMRERRRLTMHLRDCADCRRTAVTIGLDDLALAAARDRGRALRRIAGFLPLPGFLRRRMEDGAAALHTMGPARGAGRLAGRKGDRGRGRRGARRRGAGVATQGSGGGLSLPGVAEGRVRQRGERQCGRNGAGSTARWHRRAEPGGRGFPGSGAVGTAGRDGPGGQPPANGTAASLAATPVTTQPVARGPALGAAVRRRRDLGVVGSVGGVSPTNEVERLAGDVNGLVDAQDTIKKTTDGAGCRSRGPASGRRDVRLGGHIRHGA